MHLSQKLGFSKQTKLLIIHADDAGLSHSENQATIKALETGIVNSYSIMTPCPYFEEIAEYARLNPHYDHGIHITLSCEWRDYKWGPVSNKSKVSSLVNESGSFYASRSGILNNAKPDHIFLEAKAQIDKALKSGLKPSHLDSHMYTIGVQNEFIKIYKELGRIYQLPVFLNRELIASVGSAPNKHLTKEDIWVDNVILGTYKEFENQNLLQYYADALDSLIPGLNIILIHPAYDNEEMQAVTVDHPNFGSEWRQLDLEYFTSDDCLQKVKQNNAQLISWSEIQKAIYN